MGKQAGNAVVVTFETNSFQNRRLLNPKNVDRVRQCQTGGASEASDGSEKNDINNKFECFLSIQGSITVFLCRLQAAFYSQFENVGPRVLNFIGCTREISILKRPVFF